MDLGCIPLQEAENLEEHVLCEQFSRGEGHQSWSDMLLSAEDSMDERSDIADKKTGVEKNGLDYWEGEDPDEHNWDYFYITLRLLNCSIIFLCR